MRTACLVRTDVAPLRRETVPNAPSAFCYSVKRSLGKAFSLLWIGRTGEQHHHHDQINAVTTPLSRHGNRDDRMVNHDVLPFMHLATHRRQNAV